MFLWGKNMEDFNCIKKEDVLYAIKQYRTNKESFNLRKSYKYDLLFEGEKYPPKLIFELAYNKHYEIQITHKDFGSGSRVNNALIRKGFIVVPRIYPCSYDSWTVLSPSIFIKNIDKSVFNYNSSGVPTEVLALFNSLDLIRLKKKNLIVHCLMKQYNVKLSYTNTRINLSWNDDLGAVIKEFFGIQYKVSNINNSESFIRITRKTDNEYRFELVNSDIEILQNKDTDEIALLEGRRREFKGFIYERNKQNRLAAIKYHGTTCSACGFNFEETYGPVGSGFIEIHHIKPLYTYETQTKVDPVRDLIPLCPNCHSIAHIIKDEVLTIEEIKLLITKYNFID